MTAQKQVSVDLGCCVSIVSPLAWKSINLSLHVPGWLAGWLAGCAGYLGPTGWLAGLRLAGLLAGLQAAWLAGRLAFCPAGLLAGWLAGWLARWLAFPIGRTFEISRREQELDQNGPKLIKPSPLGPGWARNP